MKLSFKLSALLLLIWGYTSAQSVSVDGVITDATDHSLLEGAVIKLTSVADSTTVLGATADTAGYFQFTGIATGPYKMLISYIGYATSEKSITVPPTGLHLGSLTMGNNTRTLKDVDIVAKETRVEQKNDTSEYNAKAYKTNPDATAEDLVTKMPGITSDNGTVKAHGETVQKVYVDGKEFFGDDATLALKNLPADVIDKVQVFDKASDQSQFTGFDDGNSQKALNITTKKGKNVGVFGKVYAGYGYLTDSRYTAGASVNWFNGDRRFSLIGMSNNINQQNFSSQDLLGVVGTTSQRGGGGGGGRRGGGGGGGSATNNFLVGQQGGLSTTHSAGLNYSDVWGKMKRVKVTGSYFFNYTDNVTQTTLKRNYFNQGDSSLYNETSGNESKNMNHRVNLRIEYAIDSMNKLIFTPKLNLQQNNQTNNLFGQTSLADAISGNTQSNSTNYNFGYNISGDVLYQHRFHKPRRTFSIDVSGGANNKYGNSTLTSATRYFNPDDSTILDQHANTLSTGYTVSGSLSYTEPVGKTGILQFNYNPANVWSKSDKETNNKDTLTQAYNSLDTLLSNKYDNYYMTHRGGLTYRFTNKDMNFSVGANAQYALLNGMQVFPYSSKINHSFFNVLPSAMFTYKFKNKSTLRVFYRTSTNPPSISQLQSVVDNSNPLLLSTGNEDLKQAYNHSVMVRYGLTNSKSAQSFFAFVSASFTQKYVGNSTIIASDDTTLHLNGQDVLLHAGSQLTRPVNLDGNMSLSSFLTYGIPLDKIKCNLNLNAGFTYGRSPSMVNELLNLSNTYNVTGGVVLGSNISEKIDFTLSYTGNYNIVSNSSQTSANTRYYSHTAGAKFNWIFWKGFTFNTNVQNTLYAGVSQGYNQDIFIWNASLAYKFLKDQSLEVKAGVNDILNQNSGITHTNAETYIEDSQTKVLKRYLMLTITYTLKYFKK